MVQKTEPLANESKNVQNISQGSVATRVIIMVGSTMMAVL